MTNWIQLFSKYLCCGREKQEGCDIITVDVVVSKEPPPLYQTWFKNIGCVCCKT